MPPTPLNRAGRRCTPLLRRIGEIDGQSPFVLSRPDAEAGTPSPACSEPFRSTPTLSSPISFRHRLNRPLRVVSKFAGTPLLSKGTRKRVRFAEVDGEPTPFDDDYLLPSTPKRPRTRRRLSNLSTLEQLAAECASQPLTRQGLSASDRAP